jgi:urease accessory protein
MIAITQRSRADAKWDTELVLPFEKRQKSRLRTRLSNGEEAGVFLERGEVLRDGDLLAAEDGRVVRVRAQPEPVIDILCDTSRQLVRVAYHLGNRHVPLQIGEGWLRIAADEVLRKMAEGLGAVVVAREAPFEPEPGAYAADHRHTAPATHGGVIHEFGEHRK